jgi:futalosine hydrolase
MEGAAAAHICALYGVPFLEIRAISNFVGDRDRGTWAVEEAVETAGRAALAVVAGLGRKLEALDNGVQATGAGTRDDASGED